MRLPFCPFELILTTKHSNATNFGFLIVRRSDVALKALQDLLECPEKIPECAKRKREFSHEQMAFTQFGSLALYCVCARLTSRSTTAPGGGCRLCHVRSPLLL